MIISFETKESKVLNEFLHNYENPKGMSAQISKGSFLEFKIKRFKDLVIISQKHLFDVVAKWIFMCAFVDIVFAYSLGYQTLFYVGGIFAFTSIMWLSKYARFFSFKFNLWRKGHKEKVTYINDVEAVEKLLLELE